MAIDGDGREPTPLTPRPMIVRVLAALAIVAIVVGLLWVTVRAGHNLSKKVRNDLATTTTAERGRIRHTSGISAHLTIAPTVRLGDAALRADAAIIEERARALGYATELSVSHGEIRLGTNGTLPPELERTLVETGAVENRVVEGNRTGKSCAQLVTEHHWYWDLDHKTCYLLGPDVLGGTAVRSARASPSPEGTGWGVDINYRDNLFVKDVAKPYVGRQVAIVLDEVVSAPEIEPGITANDVRISGHFTEIQARRVAVMLGSVALRDRLVVR